jgi:enoyl-CoA hydratase/carnithine racemase
MTLIAVGAMDGVDGAALITLNRPEQRNAISAAMLHELTSVLGDLAVDPGVRTVVIGYEGIAAFRGRRRPRFKGT